MKRNQRRSGPTRRREAGEERGAERGGGDPAQRATDGLPVTCLVAIDVVCLSLSRFLPWSDVHLRLHLRLGG